jgi:hypothetical protein
MELGAMWRLQGWGNRTVEQGVLLPILLWLVAFLFVDLERFLFFAIMGAPGCLLGSPDLPSSE